MARERMREAGMAAGEGEGEGGTTGEIDTG